MIIRDEIHGTIEFDSLEERIIDSPPFQRLRRIRQMSVTNLVYPGSNHTRFEHSLGTAHLSGVIAHRLGLDNDQCAKVRLCGLLHDIGHIAFSHEGEDILKAHIGDHEAIGRKMILKGPIADILSENHDPKAFLRFMDGPYGQIISSDLGADRMDYLKRDALNTGVAYGLIDIDRIIHTMSLDKGQLCIGRRGLEAAEFLLVARFMMFSAVYLHRTVRIATAMLHKAIEGSIEDGTIAPEEFLHLEDETAMVRMLSSRAGGHYADGLLKRRLYKEVCSLPKDGWDYAKASKLEKGICQRMGCDVIVDYPNAFEKPISARIVTESGARNIADISLLVRSLGSAEGERMRILVLAKEETVQRDWDKIAKAVFSR